MGPISVVATVLLFLTVADCRPTDSTDRSATSDIVPSKYTLLSAPPRHWNGKSRCVFSLANCGLAKTPVDLVPPMSFSKGLPFALKKGLRLHNRKNLEDYIRYLAPL
ncbi:hypothetical protein AAVH_16748 [Aphelenchoides avenae]|nr:hypothetical protein AAVH_16748 [Aphelenchus avenae]